MHRLRHFYYQNKEKIWKTILIIILVLGMIYLLDSLAIDNINKDVSEVQSNVSNKYNEEEYYIQEQSAISGEIIAKTEVIKISDTISKFLKYCNNKQYTEAYDMLSTEIKENKYSSLEKFSQKYVDSKFSQPQIFEIQKWEANTYKIEMEEDLLVTGNINNEQKQLEYITIVNEDGEDKLNINEFIGARTLNKQQTKENIKVTVLSKEMYMDHEIYEFKIENLSDKTIKLDSFENTGSIYIEDSDGITYKAHKNELLEHELVIKSKMSFILNIKFANTYKAGNEIDKVVFEDVILDYDTYKKMDNVEQYSDIGKLEISL